MVYSCTRDTQDMGQVRRVSKDLVVPCTVDLYCTFSEAGFSSGHLDCGAAEGQSLQMAFVIVARML
jgi:hypothetical protein